MVISASHITLHSYSCYTEVWMFCSLFRDGSSALSITFLFDFVVHRWIFFFLSYCSLSCYSLVYFSCVYFSCVGVLSSFFFLCFCLSFFLFFSIVCMQSCPTDYFFSHTLQYPSWSTLTSCACITWLWIWAFWALDSYKLMFEEECPEFTCAHAFACLFFFLSLSLSLLFKFIMCLVLFTKSCVDCFC